MILSGKFYASPLQLVLKTPASECPCMYPIPLLLLEGWVLTKTFLCSFSLEQFYYIRDKFDFVIQQFGYKKLIHEFEKHLENPQSKGANKAYHKALWKNTPYGSAPSDEFCESLISVEWDWGNKL